MPLMMSWFVSGSVRHLKRRVVADQLAEGLGQLRLVRGAIRHDRLRDHRLGEADVFQRDRRVLAQSVLPVCVCLSPTTATISPGPATSRLSRRSPIMRKMRATRSDSVDGRVQHVVLGVQLAGVDAQEDQVAGRLADRLEGQAGERLLGVRLRAAAFSLVLGTMPVDRRPVERRRQEVHDGVEQQADAVEVLRRTAVDRRQLAAERAGPQRLAEQLLRNRLAFQHQLQQVVVGVRRRFEQVVAVLLGQRPVLLGDLDQLQVLFVLSSRPAGRTSCGSGR